MNKVILLFAFVFLIENVNAQVTPCNENDYPTDGTYYRSTGNGNSSDIATAKAKAKLSAIIDLSKLIKTSYKLSDVEASSIISKIENDITFVCSRSFMKNGKYTVFLAIQVERKLINNLVINTNIIDTDNIDAKYNTSNNSYKQTLTTSSINSNESKIPPILSISDIRFVDSNYNNRIDGNETCGITFKIENKGKGPARNLKINIQNLSSVDGLEYSSTTSIGNIEADNYQNITLPVNGLGNLSSGIAKLRLSFDEQLGFPPDPFIVTVETKEFSKPIVKVVDYSFITDNGIVKLGLPIHLKVLVQNVGQGSAENVNVNFKLPISNVFPNGQSSYEIGTLNAGESKELVFEFIANKIYSEKTIPVAAIISEKYGKYGENLRAEVNIDSKISPSSLNISSNANDKNVTIQIASLTSEVDKNIPVNTKKITDRYALIIGNEDYSSRQVGLSNEVNVVFAVNDAKIFKEYCINTLGVEANNVFFVTNATSGEMQQKIELVIQLLKRVGPTGELLFYYAGHGFPDENTKEPYLIPVDINASDLTSAIKLYDVYRKLSQTGAGRITVFIDACFTGAGRDIGLLSARGVKVKPKEESIFGNMIVFAATSEEQSALPYSEKQHGMFTYFLLKKIQETKGDISYNDLEKYLSKNVSVESLKVNRKQQDPKVNFSPQISNIWGGWKLK